MKDAISLRGERELWIEFIHKTKKEKKKVWEVLTPFLNKYVDADEETCLAPVGNGVFRRIIRQ